MPPLQNREHGADAFDLGDNSVVCVDASSSSVVAAGHGCGRDGLKPSGRRTFPSGSEVDNDFPEPSWHRLMRHGTVFRDGDASASTEPAGRTSDEARCAVSNTGGQWQLDALPGLFPLILGVVERDGTKTAGVVEVQSSSNERA